MKTTITDYELNKVNTKRRKALEEKQAAERAYKQAREKALEMREQQHKEEEEIVSRMIQVARGINQATGRMVTARELEHAMNHDMSIHEIVGNMRVAANEHRFAYYSNIDRCYLYSLGCSRFDSLSDIQNTGELKQVTKTETKTRRFAELDENMQPILDTIYSRTKTTKTTGYVFGDGED